MKNLLKAITITIIIQFGTDPPGPSDPVRGSQVRSVPADLTTWTIETLTKANMDQGEAKILAKSFSNIIEKAEHKTKEELVAALAESNRVALGKSLPKWVKNYLNPLRLKLNNMKKVDITTFTEIRDGLNTYSNPCPEE